VYAGSTLIAEVNASGGLVRSYTWGANGLVSDYSPVSGRRYYLFDGAGSTFAMTDGAGSLLGVARYGAWGKPVYSSLPSTPFACRVLSVPAA